MKNNINECKEILKHRKEYSNNIKKEILLKCLNIKNKEDFKNIMGE